MKLVEASVEIMSSIDAKRILHLIEDAGRVCYKSEPRITPESYINFIKGLIKSGHESVLEHQSITVKIICDRGISHQIVRHRIGSYSQESTRFCNYTSEKHGGEVTFISPCYLQGKAAYSIWVDAMSEAESYYMDLVGAGCTAEEARAVLPTSLKTELVATFNLRQWRHFLKERVGHRNHPQMREISHKLLKVFKAQIPLIFDDITYEGEQYESSRC